MPSLPSEIAQVFIVALITREFIIRRIEMAGCNNDVVADFPVMDRTVPSFELSLQ
jgi:hypothetical protein